MNDRQFDAMQELMVSQCNWLLRVYEELCELKELVRDIRNLEPAPKTEETAKND